MIKTIYFVFFICAFALGLWACTGKEQEKFKSLSTPQFEELIKDNKIQLVDVRTVAEYSEGHIPGSQNVPLQTLGAGSALTISKDTPLFVYCYSGARSRQAVGLLTRMGYTNIQNIGGISAYTGKVEH